MTHHRALRPPPEDTRRLPGRDGGSTAISTVCVNARQLAAGIVPAAAEVA